MRADNLGRWLGAACLAAILGAACAPPSSGRATANGPEQPPAKPKILTLGATTEPSDLGSFTATSGIRGSGNATMIAHANLSVTDEREAKLPEVAAEIPAVERGTWRVNPDGTMETTWKLRPNVRWQDGTAFTSADLLFSLLVYKDKELPNKHTAVPFIESATAPDPQTFVARWSKTYLDADTPFGPIMPRHLLEDLYKSDKDAFQNSRYFTTEFIGLGPYRLVNWELGSFMEFERFNDFFKGRPPLDRVFLRFIPDANTLISNILSGAVDVVLPPSVGQDTLDEIRSRWQGTGNVARTEPSGRFRLMDPQHREAYAQPRFGTAIKEVRQALYSAVDRQLMADVITGGLAPIADSWIPPDFVFRSDVESSIPKFPLDISRAQQLLAQAGWTKTPDGVLIHSQTGEKFELVLRLATAQGASAGKEKEAAIIRDNWKALGIETNIETIPPARAGDRQYESTVPGLSLTGNLAPKSWWTTRTDSRIIASDANGWAGGNKAGYARPRVDALIDGLATTIDTTQQVALHRELLQIQMGDIALMPLYWEQVPIFWLKEVTGPVGGRTGYRFAEWDKAE